MKIAVGLDYVVWRYQELFKQLLISLKKDKHEIGILTAHDSSRLYEDLKLWKDRGFPETDFYIAKSPLDQILSDSQWKLKKIKEHEIDWFIDNFDHPYEIIFHVNRETTLSKTKV